MGTIKFSGQNSCLGFITSYSHLSSLIQRSENIFNFSNSSHWWFHLNQGSNFFSGLLLVWSALQWKCIFLWERGLAILSGAQVFLTLHIRIIPSGAWGILWDATDPNWFVRSPYPLYYLSDIPPPKIFFPAFPLLNQPKCITDNTLINWNRMIHFIPFFFFQLSSRFWKSGKKWYCL